MKPISLLSVVFMSVLALSACSSDGMKRATYGALYQKQCMAQTGRPDCDPEHRNYDEYQRDRSEVLGK